MPPLGHARRVITLPSLAVRPLATLVSRPRPTTATALLADPATLPPRDPHARPWPGREITAGGVTLHVRETRGATDRDAVYVHGLSGSGTNWTDLAGLLAPRATGLAVDLPGFGFTRPPAAPDYTPAGHADALLSFLDGRGRPVHLLGNSLGGAIAIMVAARRPELVRSLTLVSPAMPDRRPDPRRVSDPRMLLASLPGPAGRRAREGLAAMTNRERIDSVVRLCFGDPTLATEHRLVEAAAELDARSRQPWAHEAFDRTAKAMLRRLDARSREVLGARGIRLRGWSWGKRPSRWGAHVPSRQDMPRRFPPTNDGGRTPSGDGWDQPRLSRPDPCPAVGAAIRQRRVGRGRDRGPGRSRRKCARHRGGRRRPSPHRPRS